jgi:hypothetical protein
MTNIDDFNYAVLLQERLENWAYNTQVLKDELKEFCINKSISRSSVKKMKKLKSIASKKLNITEVDRIKSNYEYYVAHNATVSYVFKCFVVKDGYYDCPDFEVRVRGSGRVKESERICNVMNSAEKVMPKVSIKEGEPCSHPGCQLHHTHPCEGCGRQW